MRISKLDAAKRQLDCAVALWFGDGDPVAVHTLTMAAYQIIQDMCTARGDEQFTLRGLMADYIKPEHLDEAIRHMRRPMNFFKHADNDPHEILEFEPRATEMYLMLACHAIRRLGERSSDHQHALGNWFFLHHPRLFTIGHDRLDPALIEQLKQARKPEFLALMLQALTHARATTPGRGEH